MTSCDTRTSSRKPDLKGSSFTLSVLHLADHNVENAINYVTEKVAQAPSFFQAAPVVLNVSKLHQQIDFDQLKVGIESAGMIPVGITGCHDETLKSAARQSGFAILSASQIAHQQANQAKEEAQSKPPKVIFNPVRSGQQVYAQGSDLIIFNNVSEGAEVIADGSIHIHGTLRGRAIAGAQGNTHSVLVCQKMQAELVSISGHYWLIDDSQSEYWQQKVMLSLSGDKLEFKHITL